MPAQGRRRFGRGVSFSLLLVAALSAWFCAAPVAAAGKKLGEAVHLDKKVYGAHDTLHVTPLAAPPGGKLLLVDSYNRILRVFPFSGGAGEAQPAAAVGRELAVPLDVPVSRFNFFVAVDAAGSPAARTEFVVTPDIPTWDDYELWMYGDGHDSGGRGGRTPRLDAYWRHLRAIGVDGSMSYENGSTAGDQIARYDKRYYCEYCMGKNCVHLRAWTQNYWPAFMNRHRAGNLDPEKKYFYRTGMHGESYCFNDPKFVDQCLKRLASVIKRHRPFRPGAYSLGDEPSVTAFCNPFDYCFSPHCLKAFRAWLKKRYGTLAALNKEWGTGFKTWDKVVPESTNEIKAANNPLYKKLLTTRIGNVQIAERNLFPDEYTVPGKENYAAWADHRSFMDDTFAGFLKKCTERAHELDPHCPAGILGTQMPSAFGGWDLWKLVHAVDWFEAYDMGNSVEMLRSWRLPNTVLNHTLFGRKPYGRYGMWRGFLHGSMGRIIFQASHFFLGGGKVSIWGPAMRTTFLELRGGIGKLRRRLEAHDQPIGVYYNQASRQLSWLFDSEVDGTTWPRRFSSWDAVRCSSIQSTTGLIRAVEDAGCQYKFVAEQQAVAGGLKNYKIVFLPKIVSLSEKEAAALREFVKGGGILVCDEAPGTFDAHCKRRDKGLLDELFGVTRTDFSFCERDGGYMRLNKNILKKVAGDHAESAALLNGVDISRLFVSAPGLRAAKGRALAKAGETAALIVNRYGKGLAVCTNVYWADYDKNRRYPALSKPFLTLVKNLLTAAGQKPYFEIYERPAGAKPKAEGRTPPRLERFAFRSGEALYFAFNVNGRVRQNELGDVSVEGVSFGKPIPLSVKLPKKYNVYNPRTNEYYGKTDLVPVELDPFGAVWLSLFPYKIKKIEVRRAKVEKGGDPLLVRYTAKLKVSGGKPGLHVFHLLVLDPDGNICDFHTRNLVAENGVVSGALRLACNGKAGKWRLRFRDAASGVTGELVVEKKAPALFADKFKIDLPVQQGRIFGKIGNPLRVSKKDGKIRVVVPVSAYSEGLQTAPGTLKLTVSPPWKLNTRTLDFAELTEKYNGETVVVAECDEKSNWQDVNLDLTGVLTCTDGREITFKSPAARRGRLPANSGKKLARLLTKRPPVRLKFAHYFEDIVRVAASPKGLVYTLPVTLVLTGGEVPEGKAVFSVTDGWTITPREADLKKTILTARGEQTLTIAGPLNFKEEPTVKADLVVAGHTRTFIKRCRIALARRTKKAPKLDGDPGDECWKKAQPLAPFLWDGSSKAYDKPTEARVCWDDKNLYILCEAGGLDPQKLTAEPLLSPEEIKQRVTALQKSMEGKNWRVKRKIKRQIIQMKKSDKERSLWGNDHFEITFDPTQRRGKAPFQLAANLVGRKYDAVSEALQWNGKWKVAGKKTKDGYVLEFAIPFKTVETKTPRHTEVWAFNIYRNDFRSKKYPKETRDAFATWSQLRDSRASQVFGRLIFIEGKK